MRRCGLEGDDVGIAVVVQIQQHHLLRARGSPVQPALGRQRTETAVQVVIQQLIRAIMVHQKEIQVAIVVGIEHRPVDGV